MKKGRLLFVSLFHQVVFIAVLQANSLDSISFLQARDLILQQNAGLKSAQLGIDASQAGVSLAGAISSPVLSVSLDKFGVNEIEASVEQEIELGGKRKLRTEIARKNIDAAKISAVMTKNDLESELIRRFVPIAITRGKLTILDSIITATTVCKEQIEKRLNAGAAKKTDLIRAEIELEQFILDRSEKERQLDQALKKFAVLGGENSNQIMSVRGSIDISVPVPSIDSLKKAFLTSPQIISFEIEKNRLSFEQKLQSAEAFPDLNISAGLLSSNTDKTISPLIGFSLDIPLFNRNSATVEQTKIHQRALSLNKENTTRLIIAEIEDLYSRLVEIDIKIRALSSSTIPKSENVYQLVQEYYNAGSVSFLDLTAIRTEMLGLQMSLLDLIAEKAFTIADLIQKTSLQIPIVK